ncbi:peptidase family C78-domain-containing protein [Phycomyces blakesleeanus]|uniref:Peptidase family C78-domain-containing protein n=1 Tax=Phycomyces blakesleeanus TaxID=4837 RepID=A0ABR3ANF3_PHYBL
MAELDNTHVQCTVESCKQQIPRNDFQSHMVNHQADRNQILSERPETLNNAGLSPKKREKPWETAREDEEKEGSVDMHVDKKHGSINPISKARNRINKDLDLWNKLNALPKSVRTPGVIPRLKPQFVSVNKKISTTAVYLSSKYTDHISTGSMDLGWGCGYRNCQMLMSFLERQQEDNEPVIKHVIHISGLQILLEEAWRQGFDLPGASQLDHHVYGTEKWIGATDVYTMLVYLGIRCTIIDFHRPSGLNNAHDALFDWIQGYFENAIKKPESSKPVQDATSSTSSSTIFYLTDQPPLYLQHSGHSRTVIGIEMLKDGHRNLIMFDPGRRMLRSNRKGQIHSSMPIEDLTRDSLESGSPEPSCGGSSNESGSQSDVDPRTDLENITSNAGSNNNCSAGNNTRVLSNYSPVIPDGLLRPVRVDSKTIAKNRQYQLLVLGEVVDDRPIGGTIRWSGEKGYLLTEREREVMKKVTSIRAL